MSRTGKKRLVATFMLVLLLNVSPLSVLEKRVVGAAPKADSLPEISSHAAVLMESSQGKIFFSQNGAERLCPASLTKIMTLILAHEALQQGKVAWSEEVTVSQKAWETGGSQMFLEIGQKVPFNILLTGIATISANDACVAISEHLYDSEAVFVQEMNKKAQELGLKNTMFQNSSGLPHPNHYSSAEDMARLAHYMLRNFPESLEMHSQTEFTFNDITQYNRNPLLGRYNGADGLKTGHTDEAGHCLIGTAEQRGLRFITVIMDASDPEERFRDTETLLNYAFRNYALHQIFQAGEVIATANVKSGKERTVDLHLTKPLTAVIPYDRQADLDIQFEIPENTPAPVQKGDSLGSVKVMLDGQALARAPLQAAENVKKAGIFVRFFRLIGGLPGGLWRLITKTWHNIF